MGSRCVNSASYSFILLPVYLKLDQLLASVKAVTFKILLRGVFPGVEWAEHATLPDPHPIRLHSHPCSSDKEQQWEGSQAPCLHRTVWPALSPSWDRQVLHHRAIIALSAPTQWRAYFSLLSTIYGIILNCTRFFKTHFSHSQDPIQELWL